MNPPLRDIEDLVKSVAALARRAVAEYAPLVDDIVHDQIRDARHIERHA